MKQWIKGIFSAGLLAGPFEDSEAAYRSGADYAAAVRIWRPLANRGDPLAEANLGKTYLDGRKADGARVEAK